MDGSPWYMGIDLGAQEDSRKPSDYFAEAITEDAFDVGDIVTLLTGSPLMTVIGVCDCGSVEIAFYDDHRGLVIESFPEETLVHWDGEDA
ncbi:DUF2158 domain-containing protein [Mesorhizobium sp. BR1-1-3]|uniref:DUF2158 domain-containing protein n=1 Tax=Mesorhizobium sp. BR1-1-3 TaxID=2876651 RepID=UPI001CD10084|nr:DUF2158 domain-containing protein [Mesorhizobium sp. BR1-1-3]MBZ9888113.1 DUF2158 domain-containing protein [Mesorhizobium sp. BR1-1-3]